MAKFIGTNSEFRRYIGPRLRNLVQQITRKHRDSIGSCEHCGATSELESAHLRGRDRNEIIDLVLAPYSSEGVAEVDLNAFEQAFKAEHDPLEKSILILCRSCHRTYDTPVNGVARSSQSSEPSPVTSSARRTDGVLPISLEPSDLAEFKRRLLITKKAEIVTYYANGAIERRDWKVRQFSASSNVQGNLRSRPEFRQGEWQRRGIVKVHVRVAQNA